MSYRAFNRSGDTIGAGSRHDAVNLAVRHCVAAGQRLFYVVEGDNGQPVEVTIETHEKPISRPDLPEPVRNRLEGKL